MAKKKPTKPVVDLFDDNPHREPSPEVLEKFETFWKPIVCDKAGRLIRNQVMRELFDLEMLISNTSKIVYGVTDGQVSKPNTDASVVIQLCEEANQKFFDQVLEDEKEIWDAEKAVYEHKIRELQEEVERLKSQLAPSADLVMDALFEDLPVPGAIPEEYMELGDTDIEFIRLIEGGSSGSDQD